MNEYKSTENKDASLYEGLNVSGRARAARVVGVSDRRSPIFVWIWERRVNRVESVLEEWVRHSGRLAIGRDDIDRLHGDNFIRRDGVSRPVPVWRSQVLGCGNPTLFIYLVRICDLQSVLLQRLLDNMNAIIMKYTRHKIVKLPHTEPHRACAKLGREHSREYNIHPTEIPLRGGRPQPPPTEHKEGHGYPQ